MKDKPTASMFWMLEALGLRKFLDCSTRVSEPLLKKFFSNAKMERGIVICTIQGMNFSISMRLFAKIVDLSVVGLDSCANLSEGNVAHSWIEFLHSSALISYPHA